MNMTLEDFLTSLTGVKDWNNQLAQITDWANAGDVNNLTVVAAMLADDYSKTSDIGLSDHPSLLETIEKTLALTPGLVQAEAALAVLLIRQSFHAVPPYRTPDQLQADTAALLAQAQSPDILSSLFERQGGKVQHSEVLACLVQEMVLRRVLITGAASAYWQEQGRCCINQMA